MTSNRTNTAEFPDALDRLLSGPAFGTGDAGGKGENRLLLEAVHIAYRHHFRSCPAYQRFCVGRGLSETTVFGSCEELPFLPVAAFKEHASLLCSVPPSERMLELSSSATSGRPSTVVVDRTTSRRQVRAMATALSGTLGPRRRPYIVVDVDPSTASKEAIGARAAAIRGFTKLAREARYVLEADDELGLRLRTEELHEIAEAAACAGEPVVVFGFTFVLYAQAIKELLGSGGIRLPPGSQVVHIGGWKKLHGQRVSRKTFNEHAAAAFGVPAESVIDFYGFTEQMGVVYPADSEGVHHAPAFAEVVVHDPDTLTPVPDGTAGLLGFVTPLPHSYPGLAVLTDDMGVVVSRGDGAHRWTGTRFRILGRASRAEPRGCGDILAEKLRIAPEPLPATAGPMGARLLFDADGLHVDPKYTDPAMAMRTAPEVGDLDALIQRLRAGRELLEGYSTDELTAIIAAAARRWADPDSPLAAHRTSGLAFLVQWCGSPALRSMADRSLRGGRGCLDGFRRVPGAGEQYAKALPRGVIAHWLAGNVPFLSMLTLAQGMITRNANLLKASSTDPVSLPLLLDAFRDLRVTLPNGRVLVGDDLLQSIAVIHFPREDRSTAIQLSEAADVRLAWGGKEAVESVMGLPRRAETEDIVFGPKLSYMAIGSEQLDSIYQAERLARRAAVDASVFDQYACASPHTVFVERGGQVTPREFAAQLAGQMDRMLGRIPKHPADGGTAGAVHAARIRYELLPERQLWRSPGTAWTVLYDEEPAGLSAPVYSRVIVVRAVDNLLEAAECAHPGIQTIGLAAAGPRRHEFAARAGAKGASRFPDIGRMTHFDSPWDGLYPLERMVRWVTLGGPYG